jgi:acyl carrier protein
VLVTELFLFAFGQRRGGLARFFLKEAFKMGGYIKEQVINILIDQLSIPLNEMKDDGNLVKDYFMDKFDLAELTTALETEFNIIIDDNNAGTWMYVKDVVDYVEEALKPE